MVKIITRIFPVLFTSLVLFACNSEASKEPVMKKSEQVKEIWYQGTVHYYDFEGGFFGVVTQKGNQYLPMNLKPEYKKEGTVIKFTGSTVENMATIQQWGTPFKFDKVELIKSGSNNGATM